MTGDEAAASTAFLSALIEGVPELEAEWQDHLEFYEGPLPHLFMADVERWAERRAIATSDRADAVLERVLDRVESGFAAGPDAVRNLIAVSFLEHLPPAGHPASWLRDLLGRTTREHVRRYEL